MHPQRAERFDIGIGRDVRLFAVALVLSAQNVVRAERAYGGEYIGFLPAGAMQLCTDCASVIAVSDSRGGFE